MNAALCPITDSDASLFVSRYEHSITSDSRLVDGVVENWISQENGIIFNAKGARGREQEFYASEYDLHSESAVSEFMVYGSGQSWGLYDRIAEFIKGSVTRDAGAILDIGCGKGILLKRLKTALPGWTMAAVEPSKNAHRYFAEVMPEVDLFNGSFDESPHVNEKFDLVIANGVLEHVPNPLVFLDAFKQCMSPDGMGFIGVPNFLNNPVDLYTYDHLSRFTPETIESLFGQCGLEVVTQASGSDKVPMWYLIRHGATTDPTPDRLVEQSLKVAETNLTDMRSAFASYDDCVNDALNCSGVIGIYGTGAIGLLAFGNTRLEVEMVKGMFDDNETMWGSTRCGIEVLPPAAIQETGITHLLISANPCYREIMTKKIRDRFPSTLKIFG